VGKQRRASKDSSFLDNRDHRRSTILQEGTRKLVRRSPTYNESRSPSRSSTASSEGEGIDNGRGKQIGKYSMIEDSQSPTERKRRRYKFAVREGERSQ